MLHFRVTYLKAMRERAPRIFNQLRKRGAMDAHLDSKEAEAREMFAQLTEGAPTLPSGALASGSTERQATETVYAALIQFPDDEANGGAGG